MAKRYKYTNIPLDSVEYNEQQTLTDEQKGQARQNIGASSISGTASGGNWSTLTINGVTNAIPSGGSGTTVYRHTVKFRDKRNFYHTVSFKSGRATPLTDVSEFNNTLKFSTKNLEYWMISNNAYGTGTENYYFTSLWGVIEYAEHGYWLQLYRGFGYQLDDAEEDMSPVCVYFEEYELASTACTDTVTEVY